MVIKQINEIPKSLTEKRKAYREQIREDIQYAIDNHINKFEFDGDYKYQYLPQYAREEADTIFDRICRDNFGRIIEPRMAEIREKGIGDKDIRYWRYGYGCHLTHPCRSLFKVTSHKGNDRNHVYMEIYLDKLDELLNEYIDGAISWELDYKRKKAEREAKKAEIEAKKAQMEQIKEQKNEMC